MELHDVTVKTVLRVILEELSSGGYYGVSIAYVVEDDVVVISTDEDLDAVAEARAESLRREVQQKLRKKIKEVHFQDTPLREAIDFIQEASGLNISVKWNLLGSEASGILEEYWIHPKRLVSLRLTDVSAEKALAAILDSLTNAEIHLVYVVDEDVITVTTKEDLARAAEAAAAEAAEAEFPQKRAERIEMKLELIERLQYVCFDPAAAGLIATGGLKDDVSRESVEIIEDLESQLAKTKSLGLRNALHLALRDLYKADGNNEKVLEHLRAMLAENDRAIAKRQAVQKAR